jgi:hypothetical protein
MLYFEFLSLDGATHKLRAAAAESEFVLLYQ